MWQVWLKHVRYELGHHRWREGRNRTARTTGNCKQARFLRLKLKNRSGKCNKLGPFTDWWGDKQGVWRTAKSHKVGKLKKPRDKHQKIGREGAGAGAEGGVVTQQQEPHSIHLVEMKKVKQVRESLESAASKTHNNPRQFWDWSTEKCSVWHRGTPTRLSISQYGPRTFFSG